MHALPIAHRSEPSQPQLSPLVASVALIGAALTIIFLAPKVLGASWSSFTVVVLTGAMVIALLAITTLVLVLISENKLISPPKV